jgi:hypothetical protein
MVFERVRTGFALVRRSGSALRDHPKLAVFPIIAGITSFAFLGVLWLSVFSMDGDPTTITYVGLFAYYLGTTFISSYSMAALMYCSRQVFRGETPRIGAGLRAASRNVGPLLVWSIVAAVVGVLIRALEENDTILSEIAAAVFSVAWTVMTFFVVPVVVFEDVSVVEMFSRSKDTVVETWGESMGAVGSIGVVTVVLGLLGAIPGVLILWLAPPGAGMLGFLALVVSVLLAVLLGQTLTGIAKTALYLYATEDEAPSYFEDIDFGGGEVSGHQRRSDRFPGSGGVV